jgi:hypothetical protein
MPGWDTMVAMSHVHEGPELRAQHRGPTTCQLQQMFKRCDGRASERARRVRIPRLCMTAAIQNRILRG